MSVRHAILALLSEGPKYGLQLQKEFESNTGEVWPLNIGQVYTTLQRLERDGLVESDESESEGPQKGFHITDAGSTELSSWLNTPPDMTSPPPLTPPIFRSCLLASTTNCATFIPLNALVSIVLMKLSIPFK